MSTESVTTFSAVLRLPEGHTAAPVLDGLPRLPAPAACRIASLDGPAGQYRGEEVAGHAGPPAGRYKEGVAGPYSVELGQLAPCGVRECEEEEGEAWLCLLVRFPILTGEASKIHALKPVFQFFHLLPSGKGFQYFFM